MLGIGAVIGTGIFVLTRSRAKGRPGDDDQLRHRRLRLRGAALCYSELASMVPVSGSAYTYTYAVMGELLAWMVGWALILEYAVGAARSRSAGRAISSACSKDFGVHLPPCLTVGPHARFGGRRRRHDQPAGGGHRRCSSPGCW